MPIGKPNHPLCGSEGYVFISGWEKQTGHIIAHGWIGGGGVFKTGLPSDAVVMLAYRGQWRKVMEFSGANYLVRKMEEATHTCHPWCFWRWGYSLSYFYFFTLPDLPVGEPCSPYLPSSSLFADSRLLSLYQKKIKPINTKVHNLFLLGNTYSTYFWLVS